MSKITSDGLTQSGTGCSVAAYPYGNSGCHKVKKIQQLDKPVCNADYTYLFMYVTSNCVCYRVMCSNMVLSRLVLTSLVILLYGVCPSVSMIDDERC